MPGDGPVRVETVEGPPVVAGDVTLIPQARRVILSRREGNVGLKTFGGWGWALVLVSPIAVIEQRGDRTQRIPIPDPTARAVLVLGLVGLFVSMLCVLVQVLVPSLLFSAQEGGSYGD
jgi:hypothetical protein